MTVRTQKTGTGTLADTYVRAADPEKLMRAGGGGGGLIDLSTVVSSRDKADKVLTTVRAKLSNATAVPQTVNQLVQQARDTRNLAAIFVGWQSWM